MTEVWFVPVIIRVLCVHMVYPWFLKSKIIHTDHVSFVNRFTLHYFFAAVFGLTTALWLDQLGLDKTTMLIMGIGAANGYAAYCQWKADQISVSLGAVYRFTDDIIAMPLGYIVLNEIEHLSVSMVLGLTLCSTAVIALPIIKHSRQGAGGKIIPAKFYGYVLVQTVIWGLAKFLMKYFAINNVPIGSWVFGWYGGAFLMTLAIFCVNRIKRRSPEKGNEMNKETEPVPLIQTIWMTAAAGAIIFAGVFLGYWALQLAPLTVVNPIFFAASIVGPVLVGLLLFQEGEQYRVSEKILVLQATFGAIFFALSFGG